MTLTSDHSWGFYGALHASGYPALALLMVMQSEASMSAAAWHKPAPDDEGFVDPDEGASGLIQFMPDSLRSVGWPNGAATFRQLSAEQQMPYVIRYYRQKRFVTPIDETAIYLAGYHPAHLMHANEPRFVLTTQGTADYAANGAVFDLEHKGYITVSDLTRRVHSAAKGARWLEAVARLKASEPPMSSVAFWSIVAASATGAAAAGYWWLRERG